MPDRNERWVSMYEMVVHPARVHGRPPAPLSVDVLSVLQRAVREAARIRQPISDGRDSTGRYLFLQDMQVSQRNGTVVLLWTLGNEFAAVPMFHNTSTSELRPAEMFENEVVATSAHMVIDITDPEQSWRYPVAMEDVDGISRGRTSRLLQAELQKITEVTAVVDGYPKPGKPAVSLSSVPGPLMGNGRQRPVAIEVLRLRPRRSLDADDANPFVESRDELIFRAVPAAPTARLLDALPNIVRRLRRERPGSRVRVRWKSDDDDKLRLTQIDPGQRAEQLLERAMTRTVQIRVAGAPLADAYPEIEPRLVRAITAALRSRD
jgi:hypothetical protein